MAINPKSLANLEPGRSNPLYPDELKKKRSVTITETGWQAIRTKAQEYGLSVSEFMEQIGRGTIKISR